MNHELAATEYDIRWLDELIQAERLQAQPTPRPPGAPPLAGPAAPRPVAQKERA